MLLVTDSSLGYGKGMSTFLHSVEGDDKLFLLYYKVPLNMKSSIVLMDITYI